MTNHIDPNIDAERGDLGFKFAETEKATLIERLRLTSPFLGGNMTGDPFFAVGVALVIDAPEIP